MTPAGTPPPHELRGRELEVVMIVRRRQGATVEEVRADIAGDLSPSAVRTMLNRLTEKGHLTRAERDGRNWYGVAGPASSRARRGAAARLVETFFGGSPINAAVAILDAEATGAALTPARRRELERLVRELQRLEESGGSK